MFLYEIYFTCENAFSPIISVYSLSGNAATIEPDRSGRLRRSDSEHVESKSADPLGLLSVGDHLLECPPDRLRARLLLPRLLIQPDDHLHNRGCLDWTAFLRYFNHCLSFSTSPQSSNLLIIYYLWSVSVYGSIYASECFLLLFLDCYFFLLSIYYQFAKAIYQIILMICNFRYSRLAI